MIYKFAIVVSALFIIFIINLVRRDKLDEKYSILWLLFGIIVFFIAIFPEIIIRIAGWFDVFYPPALLLLFGIIIVGAYIVHVSVVITKQNKMIIKLTQEVGILKQEIENKDNNKS